MFKDYTKQDIAEINKMLFPILIEHLFLASIGLLISFFLKKTGAQAVASIGMMNNVNMLMSNVFQSFGVGTAVTVAQYCGRQDYKSTGVVAKQGLFLSIGIAVALLGIGMLFKEPIIRMILADSEQAVYDYSRIYMTHYLCSMPFIATYTVAASAIRGSGFPRISLIPIVVYNFLYATFSGFSTMVFDYGFLGVCRSQLISAVIAAIIGFVLLKRGNKYLHVEKFNIGFDKSVIKPMMKISIPVLIENTFFSLGRLITQTFAIPYGTNATAANGIVNNINNIMSVPVIAALNAAPPIIGKYCGMGDKKKAKLRGDELVTIILCMQIVLSIIALIIIDPLTKVMSADEEVRHLIKQVILLKAFVQPVGYTLSFVWPAIMRSAGDAKYVMVINTLTMFIGRLGIAYALTHIIRLNILGIWIGQYSDWLFRIILFWKRYRSGKWLEFSIFDDEPKRN